MAVERIIGVDFGTSTSVIRVKRYENGKPIGEKLETKEVIFGGNGGMVPTLVKKKDDDASVSYYGYEAQQKKKEFTIFHTFKMDIESEDPAKRAQARLLTEEFYAYLAKQYKSQSEGGHLGNSDDKERTIISYPVKWSEETKEFMLETAKKAGFPNVTGMDEAQAAIQAVMVMNSDHLRQHGLLRDGVPTNILLIDMGAGTTDLVLACYVPGDVPQTEVLNTWPRSGDIQFGGREIDDLLQNFFREKLDEADAEMVFRRIGVDKFKSWKEWTVSPELLKNDSVKEFEALDSCVEMMEVDMEDYCLDRAAFENCLSDYLKQFPVLIDGCLQDACVSGNAVDLVIVTGGHSQWYFVRDMLAGKMPQFGNVNLPKISENPDRIIQISRPQETVALGLAYSGISETVEPIVAEPAFVMELTQVFSVSGGTAVGGTVAMGEVKTGDKVCVYDRAGQGILQGRVKNIAVSGASTSFQNGVTAVKGKFAVLGLDGINQEELSEKMILFKETNESVHVPLADLMKIIEEWNLQNDEGKRKTEEQERERLERERREKEQERLERERQEKEQEQERLERERREKEQEQERLERERQGQERKTLLNNVGASTYMIPYGKSIAGAVQEIKAFFNSKKMEAQYFQKDNCHIVQARKQSNSILKFAGGNKAVEVRLTPAGDDRVSLKVGGGKWVDKAGGMILSTLILGPLAPVGVIVYGANAIDQGKMIEDVQKVVEKYFSD